MLLGGAAAWSRVLYGSMMRCEDPRAAKKRDEGGATLDFTYGSDVRVALYDLQPSTQQPKGCPMTRLTLASLALAISILPSYGQNSILHMDRSGYTTGTVGSSSQNTYTDQHGNTTGWVGGNGYHRQRSSQYPHRPFGPY
jgi:hypothetical protein